MSTEFQTNTFASAASNPLVYKPSLVYLPNRLVSSNNPPEDILFLKMCCRSYFNTTNSSFGSYPELSPTDVYSGMADKISTIFVPAPKQLVSSTNVKYSDDTNLATSSASSLISGLEWLATLGFEKTIKSQTEGRRDLDITQSMFSSIEKRSFSFNFTLISLSLSESLVATSIANTLQALALPTIKNTTTRIISPVGIPVPQDKGFSPPFWRFGIGLGLSGKIDPAWLAQPQLCVLKSVSVNTSAGGSPYSIESSNPKPVLTSFSLVFTEIDPSYRKDGTVIIKAKNSIT